MKIKILLIKNRFLQKKNTLEIWSRALNRSTRGQVKVS